MSLKNKPVFLYVMDPLCGWCYGFSPVVRNLHEQLREEMDFRVVPGGMITGARVAPVSEMASYILGAYQRVEEYTGVQFGAPYLDRLREGRELNNSEPSCRALHTASRLAPELAVPYTHRLQLAIFREGKSWNEEQTFTETAAAVGIDPLEFARAWNSEEMRYGTTQDFQWAHAAGITGFPCSILQKDEQYYLLARGYQPEENIRQTLEKVLTSL